MLGMIFVGILAIVSMGIASFALYAGLSPITPREELKKVHGEVSSHVMYYDRETGSPDRVKARLFGYDRTLRFHHPEKKVRDVYRGLHLGAGVILLVEESGSDNAKIWEGQSNGNVFLHYDTVAQWQKTNKRWGLGLGIFFWGVGILLAYWLIGAVKATLPGWEKIHKLLFGK